MLSQETCIAASQRLIEGACICQEAQLCLQVDACTLIDVCTCSSFVTLQSMQCHTTCLRELEASTWKRILQFASKYRLVL